VNVVPPTLEFDKGHLLLDSFLTITKKILHIVNIKALTMVLLVPVALFVLYTYVIKNSGISILVQRNLGATPPLKLTASQPDYIVRVDTNLQSGSFTSGEAAKHIPYEADLVVEVADLQAFGDMFVEFDRGYSPVFQAIKDLVFPGFAFFGVPQGEKYSYGVVFFIKNVNDFKPDFLNDYGWLKYKVNGNVLFVSTDDGLVDEFSSVSDKLTRSVELNTKYIEKKKTIPPIGRISICILNPRAKANIKLFYDKFPEALKKLVEAFDKSNLDHGVIL